MEGGSSVVGYGRVGVDLHGMEGYRYYCSDRDYFRLYSSGIKGYADKKAGGCLSDDVHFYALWVYVMARIWHTSEGFHNHWG